MSREVTEAHYLHERSGLEAVLRPPVEGPCALCWVPRREELLVGTLGGELVRVDPVLGTSPVASGLGRTAALDVDPAGEHFLQVDREGAWRIGKVRSGEILVEVPHAFLTGHVAVFLDDHVAVVGDELDGRFLYLYRGAERRGRVRVPEHVVPVRGEGRKLRLARSTEGGLVVIGVPEERFPKGLAGTAHRLQPGPGHVLGFTESGVCVWTHEGGQPRSMRLPEVTAGDVSADGRYLGLGTRHGAVALARVDRFDKRVRPDLVRAFDDPVTAVAFSRRGRWLATSADTLILWSWED